MLLLSIFLLQQVVYSAAHISELPESIMSGISSSVAQELYSTSPTAPGPGVAEGDLRPAIPDAATAQSMDTSHGVTDSVDYLTSPQVMVAAGAAAGIPDSANSVADLASQYINQYAAAAVAAVASSQPGEGEGEGGSGITSGDSAAQDIN